MGFRVSGLGFGGLWNLTLHPEPDTRNPEPRRSLNAELANGRLAMVAISLMWLFAGAPGQV